MSGGSRPLELVSALLGLAIVVGVLIVLAVCYVPPAAEPPSPTVSPAPIRKAGDSSLVATIEVTGPVPTLVIDPSVAAAGELYVPEHTRVSVNWDYFREHPEEIPADLRGAASPMPAELTGRAHR